MSESKKPSKAPKGKRRVASEGASERPLQGSQGKTGKRSRTFSVGDSAPPTVKDVLKPRGGGGNKEKK